MLLKAYRLSRWFYNKGVPLLPKLLKAMNYIIFNCVIPPECKIGEGTKLWHHGLGIIIHPNVIIGRSCNIYNHVVIGGGYDGPGGPSFEICIGDGVNIATGAKILCKKQKLSIGDNSSVAANAVVLDDVPPNVVVGGIPAKILKRKDGQEH